MERTAAPCICHNPIMDESALAPTPMVLVGRCTHSSIAIVIAVVIAIVPSC
jgi:hypothetical protein